MLTQPLPAGADKGGPFFGEQGFYGEQGLFGEQGLLGEQGVEAR